jgi:hypothetical protein
MDLQSILDKEKETLNLEIQMKICILKAVIKSNFKLKDAFEINCKGSYIQPNAYNKMFLKNFPMGIKKLQLMCNEQNIILPDEQRKSKAA